MDPLAVGTLPVGGQRGRTAVQSRHCRKHPNRSASRIGGLTGLLSTKGLRPGSRRFDRVSAPYRERSQAKWTTADSRELSSDSLPAQPARRVLFDQPSPVESLLLASGFRFRNMNTSLNVCHGHERRPTEEVRGCLNLEGSPDQASEAQSENSVLGWIFNGQPTARPGLPGARNQYACAVKRSQASEAATSPSIRGSHGLE